MHRDSIAKDEGNLEYHKQRIDELSEGVGVNEFIYEKGRKYAKILHIENPGGFKSAHMFVDMVTGDCYKPASYKSPAKGIRYNLLNDNSREEMLRRADWCGQYLYK